MDAAPDSTAVRVALWRALHLEVDASPPVLEDRVGLELAAPDANWRQRPDMHAEGIKPFRASIVARARFIEDLVVDQTGRGVGQYVILGAGLDTFVQRQPEVAAKLCVFEIDRPAPQAWKRQRLIETGHGVSNGLKLVPVDFEAGEAWGRKLVAAGFDTVKPAVVTATGVSMYLTREAIMDMLREVAAFAKGSTFALTFLMPLECADPDVQPGLRMAEKGARASGTPFISFFMPDEMIAMAHEAGFKDAKHVSTATLAERYFAGRSDGLRPPNNTEELLVATT